MNDGQHESITICIVSIIVLSIISKRTTTVSNSITQFLTDTYVAGQAVLEFEFRVQINALIQRFET